ncbi:probable NOT transcription complex subunit VIP2 [Arachis ipaensis]|uniref:probable NOT transcription complex subunit VIP2 n=1 Tax=Arachis ipaensis TaxID=130454 RepID=UPI000A2B47CC|nr:probable NOT transcription complex subunit VIP2 [Arachis ipaensis]XP_020970690.1 probable NOT transcription complex subunit VIP2 [Arachis ipaensis]XP_020970691.1 probable NOT transcription complex subunit VIP2 [Arachis ipaensis]XP_020970692.1 probable NOT transcription complex subunit VIP2 [Arachis ipaensis]XP_020970693.1 probable NOT transcription complex subunit VIP2 [Arachis ipaensis]XP_020970694.1 probable NOT transcription complex subunit VIP2 [Arachis ipaensis]XP_020970695.1 probable
MNLQRVIQSLMCHNVITQSSPLLYMRARLPFKVFGGNIVLHILQHAQRRSTIICFKLNELHNRGWYYHKDNRFWFIRVSNMEPLVRTNTYERGSYHCFDPNTFETVHKDNFVLHYEMLEKRPPLPQHRVGIRTFIVEFQL